MTFKVSVTRRAQRDLRQIGSYLEREAGRRTATIWAGRLKARLESLSEQAHRGQSAEEFGAGRRRLGENPYVIVYEIREDLVQIVRILHGARDLPTLFSAPKAD
jgi:toxin ParE1/3/4